MDLSLIANIVLAVAAVGSMAIAIIATASARTSASSAKQLLEIESERRADERAAARKDAEDALRASLDVSARDRNSLEVRNMGRARAHDVQVGIEASGDIAPSPQLVDEVLREIGPGVGEVYRLNTFAESADSFPVTVQWTDGAGTHGSTQRVHL